MPTMLYKDLGLVKGVGFDSWRRVGGAMQAVKVYNMREVDELVLLDIRATIEGRSPDFALIDDLADDCFMPLTVGGGIRTVDDVRQLLQVGADKVSVNSAAITTPQLIEQIAAKFGSQCVVVSIDAKAEPDGRWIAYTHSGTRATGRDPLEVAQAVENFGAGEILLTSIDRDGSMTGYDIDLIKCVSDAVSIPVIASGGAGTYADMAKAIAEGHASAVAAASIFHFTEQTPLEGKRYLSRLGFNVRL